MDFSHLVDWFKTSHSSPERKKQAAGRFFRPTLEFLEYRNLLSNIDVSNLAGYQGETAIAINPTNPLNMIAGSNDGSTSHQRAYWTTDGGATWTAVDLGPTTFADPSVAFDRAGNAYFAFLENNHGIGVQKSTNGGQTWSATVEIAAPTGSLGQDKPFIAIGPDHSNTAVDRIYVAWDNADPGFVLEVSSSTDGTHWTAPFTVDNQPKETFAQPAVGPNGEFYVAWINFAVPNQSNIMFSESLNDAAQGSFTAPITAVISAVNPLLPTHYFIPAQPDRGISADPSIAVDTTHGSHRGRIYITYTDAKAGQHNDTDVKLIASDNGGGNWTAPITINNDGTSTSQFFSAVAIDPTNGNVNLAWYDARNDPNNRKVDVYEGISFDGGQTIASNRRVTTTQSDESTNNPSRNPSNYGDYLGIAAYGSFPHAVWTDTRLESTQAEEIFTEGFTWVNQMSGDFNGDGKSDVISRVLETGVWFVGVSSGSSFTTTPWATWNPTVTWSYVTVGDFNGDGKADIAGFVQGSGQWWVGISSGTSFNASLWSTWSPLVSWTFEKGDFNGDRKTDIAGFQNGEWWVGLSTGTSFSTSKWATWSSTVSWTFEVGDFNGDGKTDIAGFQNGEWWVGLSTGTSFSTTKWDTWNPNVTWTFEVGDFNGDGKTDIAGFEGGSTAQWWVGLSSGSSFNTSLWATWSPAT